MTENIYHEISTGGRWSPRTISVGEVIGKSKVLADLGVTSGCRRFEVTCEHCECIQIRSAGQLNTSLRRKTPVTCPRCLTDGRIAHAFETVDYRTERVLAGG